MSNNIRTTKYNAFTFVPLSFIIQFARVVNCFYLVNVVFQFIPSVSTNDPLATLIPLTFVILLGMLREGIADFKRFRADRKTNALPVH